MRGAPAEVKAKIEAQRDRADDVLNLPTMPEGCNASYLMQKEFPEPRWIVPELLTEGLGILAGRPKTGKSWMALNLAVASASGGRALGKVKVDKGPVLYLALEDTERRLKSRLEQVLCGNMPPEGLHFQTSWPRIDQGALPMLQKWLEDHPDTRFVIIDTLARLWPKPNGRDGSAYHQDYDTVAAIKNIADLHCVAILCVTHLRKSPAEDPLEQITGSMGISGSADTLLVLQRSRGKADANLLVTGRDVEETELALRFDPASGTWHHLGDADEYRRSQEQGQLVDILKESNVPLSPVQIAEMLGTKRNSVQFLLRKLVQDGIAKRVGHGWYIIEKKNTLSLAHHTHHAHITHNAHFTHLSNDERSASKMSEGHSSLDAQPATVCGESEQSERSQREVKCAECSYFHRGDPPNMYGRCVADQPHDGNEYQFPQLVHVCASFQQKGARA